MKNKIKEHVADLRVDEKIVVGAGILAVFGCLFPWKQGYFLANGVEFSSNGFNGQTWFIGWLVAIFAVISMVVALLPQYSARFRSWGMERMAVPFFLGAESVLLVFVAFTVLLHNECRTQGTGTFFEDIGLGFFIVLLATAFITLGGVMGLRHENRLKRDRANRNPNDFLRFEESGREHGGEAGWGEEKPALNPEVNEHDVDADTDVEVEDDGWDDLGDEDENDDDKQQSLSLD